MGAEDPISWKTWCDSQMHREEQRTNLAIHAVEIHLQNTDHNLDTLAHDIQSLRETRAKLEGVATQKSVYTAYLLALVGIALSLLHIVH